MVTIFWHRFWPDPDFGLAPTLHPSFDGSSPLEVMMKALEGKKIPITQIRPDISVDVVAFVDRLMHVDPARRFPDADAVVQAIRNLSG